MHIELINTGQELLLGRILNTHQQWICRQLADLGYEVNRQSCVADDGAHLTAAVREALGRSDLVITTGGLGPTSDDLTRELIAKLLGRALELNPAILAGIEEYFMRRHTVMVESAKVQAMIPAGARVLPNANGTAPGLVIEVNPNTFRPDGKPSWLVLLPGPPRELRPMFLESVVPLVLAKFPSPTKFFSRTLKTTGLGESFVEEKIAGPLRPMIARGLELGYCARIGEVEVRLAARGAKAESLVAEGEGIVRGLLRGLIFAVDDGMLEQTVVRMLGELNESVAVAESCTGGLIAHRLTNVPGASAVFKCGLVTYSNEAKINLLGVNLSALAEHGAVSEVIARQMAEGARKRCGTGFAIAVTGIAGPSGGTGSKPVGTVFIALADERGTIATRKFNPFDRETFKSVTSQQALDLLRRRMSAEDFSADPSR
ncbi:MAG TPA: competence/damage-inducible protein A [Verrucomicrobiae bacterium]|jgi:nicotinamide-nucleotide amidase|nr:competence/damage-inducible protein A [Verrucomicrobiae bacterium]